LEINKRPLGRKE